MIKLLKIYFKNKKIESSRLLILFVFFLGLFGLLSCETDENYVDTDSYTFIKAEISYYADEEARYKIEFNNKILADTLPYDGGVGNMVSISNVAYFNINNLSGNLKVWRYSESGSSLTLEMDTPIKMETQQTINLAQIAPGGFIQFPPISTLTEIDNNKTSIFLYYSNKNQKQNVDVSIIAVDYITYLKNRRKLSKVPEEYKKEVSRFNLYKNSLSEEIVLDLDYYSGENKGIPPLFLYAIYDSEDNSLIIDYDAKREIEIGFVKGTLNPINRKEVMQLKYKSEELPFDEPESIKILAEEW